MKEFNSKIISDFMKSGVTANPNAKTWTYIPDWSDAYQEHLRIRNTTCFPRECNSRCPHPENKGKPFWSDD